jgi:hypothetical protein
MRPIFGVGSSLPHEAATWESNLPAAPAKSGRARECANLTMKASKNPPSARIIATDTLP